MGEGGAHRRRAVRRHRHHAVRLRALDPGPRRGHPLADAAGDPAAQPSDWSSPCLVAAGFVVLARHQRQLPLRRHHQPRRVADRPVARAADRHGRADLARPDRPSPASPGWCSRRSAPASRSRCRCCSPRRSPDVGGIVVGLPALRIRGAQLAIVTLAAAVAIERFVFDNPQVVSGRDQPHPRPRAVRPQPVGARRPQHRPAVVRRPRARRRHDRLRPRRQHHAGRQRPQDAGGPLQRAGGGLDRHRRADHQAQRLRPLVVPRRARRCARSATAGASCRRCRSACSSASASSPSPTSAASRASAARSSPAPWRRSGSST